MRQTTWDILLVEDEVSRGAEIERALKVKLPSRFKIRRLGASEGQGAYEDRLFHELKKQDIVLIVTDRDLSGMQNYPGLSEAPVSKVAAQLHIPVCVYASGKPDSLLERQRAGGGGRILLDASNLPVMARKVIALAEGFLKFRECVVAISKSNASRRKYRGPATVLADLLGAPEVVDHIALYARGDQRMIAGLTPSGPSKKPAAIRKEEERQVALALGVWLYDSILRFPGVVLDAVAAGSLLGIEPKAMRDPRVNKAFVAAIYSGPFSDAEEPRWWRHRLVDLTAGTDGRVVVKKATGKAPPTCRCSVDQLAPAGFVCVMTGEPVCEPHSVGEVSWLPRGADLARVRRDLFEKVGPWVGML